MKKLSLMFAGLAVAATSLPAAASAQQWQSINGRQARIEARINQGIRSGALNRKEAVRLRTQFRELATLEARYRRTGGGLSVGERRDLDRRFDRLSARVKVQKNDRQQRW
ncbi:hypothetical protein [Sphingomonas sp. IW22]|uniref:hypothetical protein n=1 Tax=Sphingomonas sp. IW22 TaxID=3242489 RepID=UPI00352227D9